MESKRTATTYFIPPGKFLLMENALGNPDLIQSSVSADCRVTIVDKDNFPLDELEQWPTFRLTAADIRLNLGASSYYIYIVVPTANNAGSSAAFISYHTSLVDRDGYEVIQSLGPDGSPVSSQGSLLGKAGFKYYRCGTVSARGGNASATTTPSGQGRLIEVDLGVTPAPSTLPGHLNDFDKIFQIDKADPSNPNSWLLTILVTIRSLVARVVRITDRLIFGSGKSEKPVTGVAVASDVENLEVVNDTTLATTAWVSEKLSGISDAKFLRKDQDDSTPYRLTVGGGVDVGRFVTGSAAAGGSGARIDNEGRAEMHSLTIREFMEVPELRFNRNDVISGILWNAPAFGLIQSVDTSKHVCTLKLEEGELSGLHTMDICMGIFSNFGEGSETEDGVDDNGFPTMVGFSTSYFTPIEIIKSGKGVCQFRYQLQEGTSVHPCQSMKFAVYGNFVDKSRQASAYSTRTYKRYISGVNTWKVDPDKHIYAQFGLLDGLTIGGTPMKGYGSYQHNCYLSGAFIRFTPQQKEELKGESAYSVVLTDYEGIAVLGEDGTLLGGEAQPMNVVTGDDGDVRNVITDGQNVITDIYRLSTHVQAMRGSTRLHYAFTTEKDGYTITLNPTGCKAGVFNGMVAVTSIDDPYNASVEIIVTCEGMASFSQTYTVTTVADGESVLALTASAQAVTRNSHGHYEPSSVIIRSVKGTKERRMYMQMYGKKSDTEYVKLDMSKYTNPDVKWDVNLMALEGADYKSVIFRSYKDTLEGKTYQSPFDAEVTVNFVNEGSSGAMARNRGEFKSGTQYAYNDEYRDYVWYNDGTSTEVYLRQGKYETTEGCEEGHIKGIPVTDGTYWVKAERSALTAIDTALIDTANIAGFMFKNGLLVSQEQGTEATKNNPTGAKIVLDGNRGYFKCVNADIDGNINVGSLKYKTITSSGSMEGTAFGLGGNIYTLPILSKGQNMEVKVLYPRVDSRMASTLFMVQVDYRYMSNGTEEGKASIVVPDEEKVWAKIETSVILKENILYTLFGFCDSQGYTTWYIGASYGSTASLPINVNVDNEVIEGSTNPVSGGAVYDKFNELVKVKKISSVDELTNDPILYII